MSVGSEDRIYGWLRLIRNRVAASPIAVARALLAVSLAATLATTSSVDLFVAGGYRNVCGGENRWLSFCVLGPGTENLVVCAALMVCIAVVSGKFAAITGVLHAYFAFSFSRQGQGGDGGDVIASNLAFILLPLCFAHQDYCSWAPSQVPLHSANRDLIAAASLLLAKAQMALVYFDAALSKTMVQEWRDGTAMFYVLSHPTFGGIDPLVGVGRLIASDAIVLVSWAVVAFEFALAFLWLSTRRKRAVLTAFAMAFHVAIALLHGLPSFALAMMGGLVLYGLVPLNEARVGARGSFAENRRVVVAPQR